MKRIAFSLFLLLTFVTAESQIHRSMKGIWIATFSNIDWPQRNQSPAQQQASLLRMLDTLKSTGFNTVYFQVRSQCDALYQSSIDPWTADLTGTQGLAPNPVWDPLQFAIDEAHKRNMELHAWINPYRAIANINSSQIISPNHVSRKHPEWLLKSGTLRTLNPALQEVRNYIEEVISYIVVRYDVDGIHFDDYFYPEGDYNDDEDYRSGKGNFTNKADWRRNNVDLLIKQVSEIINKQKPWVKFGISPTGIYLNSSDFNVGSATKGKQHYSELFSDTKKWLKEGWIDYLEPQLYWYFSQPGSAFDVLTKWWNSNAFNRDMYIGIGGYKVGINEGWRNANEIPNQIRYALSPEMKNIKGVSVFSAVSVLNNKLGFKDSLRILFQTPSLIPPMPWKDNIPPAKPENLSVVKTGSGFQLNWNLDKATNEMDKPKNYVIYSSSTLPVLQNSENVIDIISTNNFYLDSRPGNDNRFYLITAVDRLRNESEPSETVSTLSKPLVTLPPSKPTPPVSVTQPAASTKTVASSKPVITIKLYATPKLNNALTLRWEDKNFSLAEEFAVEKSINNKDFSLVAKLKPRSEIMFYDVKQLLENCYFRIRRSGEGSVLYSNIISYEFQAPAITGKNNEESETALNKETPKVNKENPQSKEVPDLTPETAIKPDTVVKPKNVYVAPVQKENKLGTVSAKYRINTPVSILINTVGQIEYTLFGKNGSKITWGKIKSVSEKSKVVIPGTNNLAAGEYKLELKKVNENEFSNFIIE